jgi:hypothetical protein
MGHAVETEKQSNQGRREMTWGQKKRGKGRSRKKKETREEEKERSS